MKKKLLSLVLGAAMVAATLAGCGSKEAPASTDKPAAESSESSDAAEPAADGGKTIVYWSMWEASEPQAQAIQEAVDAYQAATGNTVDLQFKGRTGIREGLQPALDAGTTIDLFDEDIDRVNKTWGDYLLDLEDLVAENNYEETAIAGLMGACREVAGGTLKSIPYQPNVFAFFYNEDIFAEAGVTKTPATWAELLDACQKIKDAGYTPITCDDAYITCMFGYHLGRLIGEDGVTRVVTNGEWAEEPAVLEMAKAYEELASKGYFSETIASNVWPAAQNTELAGKTAAMYLNGSWLPNEVKEMAGDDFHWGCFNYPAVDGGATGIEAANYGAQVLAINKNTEVAAEAFEIIKYITKGEYDQKLSEYSIGIPADTTNTEWPSLLANVKPVMDSLTTRWSWAVNAEANVDITPVLKENFLKLCGGQLSAQEFVDTMEDAASN